MSSDDFPRFMKSTGRSATASRGRNTSRRTLRREVKRLVSLCAGAQKSCPACAQGSLNILSNVAAGDFRNCVSPVPLRHFYAISTRQVQARFAKRTKSGEFPPHAVIFRKSFARHIPPPRLWRAGISPILQAVIFFAASGDAAFPNFSPKRSFSMKNLLNF